MAVTESALLPLLLPSTINDESIQKEIRLPKLNEKSPPSHPFVLLESQNSSVPIHDRQWEKLK